MEDFRRQFTLDAAASLAAVSAILRREDSLSDASRREFFRTLHTIKGTAQTFGFATASRLAHRLETMLAASDFSRELFGEGIGLLRQSLENDDFQIPPHFLEKTGIETPVSNQPAENLTEKIPAKFLAALSVQEKNILQTALRNEQNVFCLETSFRLDDFADGLIRFRERLNAHGEIIATLPSAQANGAARIGFQILYATTNRADRVNRIARENDAEIIFDSTEKISVNSLQSVARLIVRHAEEIAAKDGKSIEFEIVADDAKIVAEELKIVFDVLLHLVRNAVDHAINQTGKIEIHLRVEDKILNLKVSDSDDGINLAAIRAKAIEKNLISEDANLSERETIDLIFAPEFSTKSSATEISGRGIGLNAVATLVEKSGGTIEVKTRSGTGTTFEIALPISSK